MTHSIVIQDVTSTEKWNKIFHYLLSLCDEFTVTFPKGEYDKENPLMGGKKEFDSLENLKVDKSLDLRDGILLSGKLNADSKKLFEQFMEPSYDGFKPMLWHFSLLKDNNLILEVSDFTVCVLEKTEPLLLFLNKADISISSLES